MNFYWFFCGVYCRDDLCFVIFFRGKINWDMCGEWICYCVFCRLVDENDDRCGDDFNRYVGEVIIILYKCKKDFVVGGLWG